MYPFNEAEADELTELPASINVYGDEQYREMRERHRAPRTATPGRAAPRARARPTARRTAPPSGTLLQASSWHSFIAVIALCSVHDGIPNEDVPSPDGRLPSWNVNVSLGRARVHALVAGDMNPLYMYLQ